jgi:three-Cys-motif partner protein
MLKFMGDAISLSGLTGTKLKCEVIGLYYPFWWKITSGGRTGEYLKHTAIIELNAATCEDYIKDTKEVVLGSAGHALELKVKHLEENDVDTTNLKVILIEEDGECYKHLKRVIKRRWPNVSIEQAEGPLRSNSSNIYLLNKSLDSALRIIDHIQIGNAIYYFDPLRSVHWTTIEKVAKERIRNVFQTGTEFMIFLFTSDWFLGRDEFAPLPTSLDEEQWSDEQKETVLEADALFGNKKWQKHILNAKPISERQRLLVLLYKRLLLKWFRYALAMPFAPKKNQLFHLILCSNYDVGVRATRDFYASRTGNPPYLRGRERSNQAYGEFKNAHPEELEGLTGNQRPLTWRLLWRTIKQHEGGVCDPLCKDFADLEPNRSSVRDALRWLYSEGYLELLNVENAWNETIRRYRLNWKIVKKNLGVEPPPVLRPISSEEFAKFQWRKLLHEALKAGERGE